MAIGQKERNSQAALYKPVSVGSVTRFGYFIAKRLFSVLLAETERAYFVNVSFSYLDDLRNNGVFLKFLCCENDCFSKLFLLVNGGFEKYFGYF